MIAGASPAAAGVAGVAGAAGAAGSIASNIIASWFQVLMGARVPMRSTREVTRSRSLASAAREARW